MKASKNAKSKVRRTLSIPEDDIPVYRYYNQSAIGLKILFENCSEGEDMEYTDRIKYVYTLIMQLAGAPETYPPTAPKVRRAGKEKPAHSSDLEDAVARVSISNLWLYLTNILDALSQYASAGNKEAQRYLNKALLLLKRLLTTSVTAGFGKA